MSDLTPPVWPAQIYPPPPPPEPVREKAHRWRLLIAGLLAAVVIAVGLLVFFVVVRGIPSNASKASDGTFYVVLPSGWQYSQKGFSFGAVSSDFFAGRTSSEGTRWTNNVNVIQTGTDSMSNIRSSIPAVQQQLSQAYGASDFSSLANSTVSGEAAISYTYQLTLGANNLKGEQIFCVHNGKDYVITLTTTAQDFDSVVSTDFQSMIGSWHWL